VLLRVQEHCLVPSQWEQVQELHPIHHQQQQELQFRIAT
jgi:hypothetical protein